MTIREIITKLEDDNNILVSENNKLKKENQKLYVEKRMIENELKSLKKLLNADNSKEISNLKEKRTRKKKNIEE